VSASRLARAADLVATTEPREIGRALAVGGLVLLDGGSKRETAAAMLSPVDGLRIATILDRVGGGVARLVRACRELEPTGADRPSSAARWRQQQGRVLRRLEDDGTAPAVVRIHAAGALHDLRMLTAELRQRGPEVWAEREAGAVDQLWRSRSLAIVLTTRAPGFLSDEVRASVRVLEELADWWFDVGHPQTGRRSR
jgi:hypothetical protein